jgi:hypothetical protein
MSLILFLAWVVRASCVLIYHYGRNDSELFPSLGGPCVFLYWFLSFVEAMILKLSLARVASAPFVSIPSYGNNNSETFPGLAGQCLFCVDFQLQKHCYGFVPGLIWPGPPSYMIADYGNTDSDYWLLAWVVRVPFVLISIDTHMLPRFFVAWVVRAPFVLMPNCGNNDCVCFPGLGGLCLLCIHFSLRKQWFRFCFLACVVRASRVLLPKY